MVHTTYRKTLNNYREYFGVCMASASAFTITVCVKIFYQIFSLGNNLLFSISEWNDKVFLGLHIVQTGSLEVS